MKAMWAIQMATLLSVSITGVAATVDYDHPNLTIVAEDEPLDSVLKSLGKEMRIYIVAPAGFNPILNCDIQQRPIKQAIKVLLGDMSYSLEWEEKTGQLAGLTILAGAGGTAVAAVSTLPKSQIVSQAAPAATPSTVERGTAPTPVDQGGYDTAIADHEARMETHKAEHEARMAADRAAQEARMVEERAAQEERMEEDIARHEEEMAAYLLESQGLQPAP